MTRRAISPAARGVLLAVSAALRGRDAEIHDAAGTTTARVVDPDGTVILDVRVRATSSRRDTRQIALPLAPGPRHAPPAEVAQLPTPRVEIRGLAVGDRIDFDEEGEVTVVHVDVGGFAWRAPAAGGADDDEGYVYWSEVEQTAPGRWIVRPVRPSSEDEAAKRERAEGRATARPRATPNRTGKPRPHRLAAEPGADQLCEHGKVCLVGLDGDGRWELFAADTSKLSPESWTRGVEVYQRVRQYNRSGRCTRDTADEGGAS